MKHIIIKIIQFILIITVVVVSSSKDITQEYKVYNTNLNKTVNLSTMAMKIVEFDHDEKYSAKDTFTGDLTGYVYNCPACNGHLGCMYKYNIMDGKTTYDDETYGKVSIVASSSNLPCGSIIRFETARISEGPIYAIVLDRGVRGNSIDYLSPSEEYALKLGRSTITYDVLRSGW